MAFGSRLATSLDLPVRLIGGTLALAFDSALSRALAPALASILELDLAFPVDRRCRAQLLSQHQRLLKEVSIVSVGVGSTRPTRQQLMSDLDQRPRVLTMGRC